MTVDKGLGYTGSAGRSFVSPKAQEVAHKQEQQSLTRADDRSKLLPAEDIITKEFEREIAEISSLDYLNVEAMFTDEHLRSELMARKKTIERLKAIQLRLTNLLRDNKGGKNE